MGRLAWYVAAAITIGFVLAEYLPGRLATFYVESLGPFAGSCWLGAAIKQLWKGMDQAIQNLPPTTLLAMVAFVALALLLGGFRLFWVDPWLFGIAIAPLWEAIKVLLARSQPAVKPAPEQTGLE